MEDGKPSAASTNHWALTAQLVEMAALRFSPAGIPVLDCVLMHQSEMLEAGSLRKVQVQLKAVAMGTVAEQLGQQPLGLAAQFAGFMGSKARARQASHHVVFHIQSFAPHR